MEEAAGKWSSLEDKKFEVERRKAFEERLEKAAQGAAGKLHKWTKPVAVWKALVRQEAGKGPAKKRGPVAEVEEALREWAKIWKVDQEVQKVDRPWEKEGQVELEPLTGSEVGQAALAFKESTGIGSDDIHPRAVARLTEEGKETVAVFLTSAERSRVWPKQAATLLVWLALKEGGGYRPLVLLPSLIRLWEQARHGVLVDWQRNTERSWDATRLQGGSEEAAWEALVMHEAGEGQAAGEDIAVASTVMDLAKAFETVSLVTAWRWCRHWGMNSAVLAVVSPTSNLSGEYASMAAPAELSPPSQPYLLEASGAAKSSRQC